MAAQEVLISGKTSFKVEVPYRLIETGGSGKKPLILYLHGFNQNVEEFQQSVDELMSLEAYHLFIQGPYPIFDRKSEKKVKDWGRAWYLYDGEQDQFLKSLELASEFIQEIVDKTLNHINVSRLAVIGYSMGGYLAGHFALSRWKHVNELIVVGGRIKTEAFEKRRGNYEHMNVLALHGRDDKSVSSQTQERSCRQFSEWGAKVTFREVEAGHAFSSPFRREIKKWLKSLGYK